MYKKESRESYYGVLGRPSTTLRMARPFPAWRPTKKPPKVLQQQAQGVWTELKIFDFNQASQRTCTAARKSLDEPSLFKSALLRQLSYLSDPYSPVPPTHHTKARSVVKVQDYFQTERKMGPDSPTSEVLPTLTHRSNTLFNTRSSTSHSPEKKPPKQS